MAPDQVGWSRFQKRDWVEAVLSALNHSLWWWLIGIGKAVVGVPITTGLLIIGVPLAPVWGILAGILEIYLEYRAELSAVPALLLAFAKVPMEALYTAPVYLGAQSCSHI